MIRDVVSVAAWVASFGAVLTLLPQIWRIHVHKEVRDLSKISFWGLAIFSTILLMEAIYLKSGIYIVKQAGSALFAFIILWQIKIHEKDKWEE